MGKHLDVYSNLGLALLSALLAVSGPASFAGAPSFKKVMIVVLENTNYQDATTQPFLSQLAQGGATFSDFSAESHPSQPNYVAMIAGSTFGVRGDSTVDLTGAQIGDLLEQHGKSWKVYAEDYPGDCFLGSSSGKYYRKHVPFISFTSIQQDPARCARIVNATELDSDIGAGTLPDYSFYVPNIDHDGHNTGVSVADQWLSGTFGSRLQDPGFMKDVLFIVTFDESESLFGNQIFTVFYGPDVVPGSVVSAPANHYSILRTIEDAFGLGSLNQNDAQASLIQGIWR